MAVTITPVRILDPSALAAELEAATQNIQTVAGQRDSSWDILNVNDILYGPGTAPGYGGSNSATLNNPNAPTANVWQLDQFPNFSNNQNTAVVITGWEAQAPIPHLKAVRFWRGNVPLAYIPLQPIYAYPETEGYFNFFLYYGNTDHIQVDLLFDLAVGANAEEFMLKGFVGRPKGALTQDASNTLGQLISGS